MLYFTQSLLFYIWHLVTFWNDLFNSTTACLLINLFALSPLQLFTYDLFVFYNFSLINFVDVFYIFILPVFSILCFIYKCSCFCRVISLNSIYCSSFTYIIRPDLFILVSSTYVFWGAFKESFTLWNFMYFIYVFYIGKYIIWFDSSIRSVSSPRHLNQISSRLNSSRKRVLNLYTNFQQSTQRGNSKCARSRCLSMIPWSDCNVDGNSKHKHDSTETNYQLGQHPRFSRFYWCSSEIMRRLPGLTASMTR